MSDLSPQSGPKRTLSGIAVTNRDFMSTPLISSMYLCLCDIAVCSMETQKSTVRGVARSVIRSEN
jgi:hypothetical protein